ncbi:hypothetical protein FHT39_002421 [Mitsuaria sp. BK045]|uniref:hypothetical protein n=1 Tax=unclassified Roseateles TaxID=2626991 RepID=UPI0016075133|nr:MULTISPECIES: hypothetical protein [unclassified Roseateles]MBB3293782.1 hypothetical protein [Mitsuaria sp. BK041]MBB3362999.1 hypothetical protein [Mitsuaria sp. BK045]
MSRSIALAAIRHTVFLLCMPRSLQVTDTTVVIRPATTTMWLWLFVFATGLSWMFWKFTFYDTSPKALLLLLFPSMMLFAVLVDFVQTRAFVTTIDRARNLVLIERLPRFGLSAKQQKFVLSDFAAVESHSVAVGRSLACRVSLVTPGLRSLVLLNGSGGYGAKSFWRAPMPAETEEAASVRVAVAKVSGLTDMGYRGTIGLSVVAYEPIDA